jgi:pilus assembly protein CpaE
MFGAIVLSTSADRCQHLKVLALETNRLIVLRELDDLPEGYQLLRLLHTVDADVVLLDLQDAERARECADAVRESLPDLPVIGIGPEVGTVGPGASVTVQVPFPPDEGVLEHALDEALHLTGPGAEAQENLIAFVPAKAGCGTSTIVLNTAIALAVNQGKKVLVLEADLRSGVLSIMLASQPVHSIQELLAAASGLDGLRLGTFVHSEHGVDWLVSNRSPAGILPTWADYFHVLKQVRSRYDVVLADLPELVNPATREIVRRARMVFSVCTPEVLPLRLAEFRLRELEERGVQRDRMQIVLNRWVKSEMTAEDVSGHLKQPVFHVFPNDYRAVRTALLNGGPVGEETAFWRECANFAARLTGTEAPKESLQQKIMSLFRSG